MRAVLAGLVLLLAAPVSAQTGSGLERLTRRDQTFGWEAVGRVDIGTRGFCTGTLIATDLVLTAAHCLYDSAGRAHDPATLVFRAGLRDGEPVAVAAASRAVAHPRYDPAAAGAANLRHDAALLQLARPIPAAVAAPFVVQPPQGREVSVVSYARERAEALSWQRACTVLGRRDGLLAFDCEADFGSSGAPVFDRSQGRARIVSLISAGGVADGRRVVLGMELPALVAELKAALRAGGGPAAALPGVRRIQAGDGARDTGARFLRPPGP